MLLGAKSISLYLIWRVRDGFHKNLKFFFFIEFNFFTFLLLHRPEKQSKLAGLKFLILMLSF